MNPHGRKNTTDPQSKDDPITEGAGLVTSDSLAAESVRQDGKFGSNEKAGVSSQPSKSTTSNVTDNSNVAELPPAPYAAARLTEGDPDGSSKPGGVNKIAERAGHQRAHEFADPQSTVGEHGGPRAAGENRHAEQSNLPSVAGERERSEDRQGRLKGEFHADPHSTIGEHGTVTSGDEQTNANGSSEGLTSELHTTVKDTGTRHSLRKNLPKPGSVDDKLIQERQANLELPEQPPVASDWNSVDERKVNINVN